MSDALTYRVQDILDQGGLAVRISVPPERLFAEPLPDAAPAGPLEAALEFAVGTEEILLTATLSGGWRLGCSRCLKPHTVRFTGSFEDTFPAAEAVLDVSEPLRETALIEIPQRSLCRPDCRGLCPRCGQDLNEGPCRCRPEAGSPFDVLKRLKE